jgi:hypothetical protein
MVNVDHWLSSQLAKYKISIDNPCRIKSQIILPIIYFQL